MRPLREWSSPHITRDLWIGTLGLTGTFHRIDTYLVPPSGLASARIATLGGAFAIALVYFLAAQVGLAFLATPSSGPRRELRSASWLPQVGVLAWPLW